MGERLGRIAAIAVKEIRQLSRDRLSLGMIIGIPLLQILLFGYAINLDVRHLPAGVADMANTELSRALIADAQASQVVNIRTRVTSAQALERLLRNGKIAVGIYIPPDFDRRVDDARWVCSSDPARGLDAERDGFRERNGWRSRDGTVRGRRVHRHAPHSDLAVFFSVAVWREQELIP